MSGHRMPHDTHASFGPRVRDRDRAQHRDRDDRGGLRLSRQLDGAGRRRRAQSVGRAWPGGRPGPAAMMAKARHVAAFHLRAQEGIDPRGADQRLVLAGRGRRDRRRSDPPAVPSRRRPRAQTYDLGRGGRHSRQRRHGPAVRTRPEARHQHPGRLPAHGGRRCAFRRRWSSRDSSSCGPAISGSTR